MSNSCDVISPCSCCYTNLSNSSATPLPTTCDGGLFAGRIGGVSSRPGTPTPAQPYGSDSLSKNRPGALTQVSGWSPFVSRRPEWCKTSIPPTVPVLIDDGRVRRLPQGLCTPPFTHVPGGVGNRRVRETLNTGWQRSEPAHDQLAHHPDRRPTASSRQR